MRIGIFTDTYLPNTNGVVTVIRLMERELRKKGHEVCIFAPVYPGYKDVASGIYRFPSLKFLQYEGLRVAIPYDRKALRVISSLDMIHSHDPFSIGLLALWASKRYHIPHIFTYHGLLTEYRNYLPRPIRPSRRTVERLSRVFCDRCDAIISPSVQMKRVLKGYGMASPIFPLPFGVDEEEFSRPITWNVRAALDLPTESLLLHVGRLGWEKNVEFLLRSFKRLLSYQDGIRLIIAGDGPRRTALENCAAKLGIAPYVVFTGHLPREMLIDLYKQATLFVFSSKTETLGLVLLEAMMAGIPPVALGKMGVLDVVSSGKTGILAKEDEEDFAACCHSLLQNEEKRRTMGKAARQHAIAHSAQASMVRLLEIYEEARRWQKQPPVRFDR